MQRAHLKCSNLLYNRYNFSAYPRKHDYILESNGKRDLKHAGQGMKYTFSMPIKKIMQKK